jgi:hypothetical protein
MAGLTVTARNTSTGAEYQTVSVSEADAATTRANETENQKPPSTKQEPAAVFSFERLEPGRYVLAADCIDIDRILGSAVVVPGKTAQLEILAMPLPETGNVAVDKFVASSTIQGGRYPGGNISYLNINDSLDIYFMVVYFGILGLLSVYGVYRYRLVYLFLRYRKHRPQPKSRFTPGRLPRVTVQLPLFNEMYVAERLIDAVVKLDYPRELLEIQVLDDSTDDTQQIASAAVNKHFNEGFDIVYCHRATTGSVSRQARLKQGSRDPRASLC